MELYLFGRLSSSVKPTTLQKIAIAARTPQPITNGPSEGAPTAKCRTTMKARNMEIGMPKLSSAAPAMRVAQVGTFRV